MKSANVTNSKGETYPKPFFIDTSSIYGHNFARTYINELLGHVYESMDGLTDKQLAAIKTYAKSRTKKKSEIIFYHKEALIQTANYIINLRKLKRKRINNY